MLTSLQFVLGQISWLLRSAIVLILAMGLSSGKWMFMTFRLVLYGLSLQKPFFKHVIWYVTTSTVVRRVQYRSSRRAKVEIIKSLVLMQQQKERDARLREVNAHADFDESMMKSSNTTTPTTSAMRRNVTISAPEKSPSSSAASSPRKVPGDDEEKAKNDTLFTMSFNHFVKSTSRCSRPVSPAAGGGGALQGSFGGGALPKAEDNVSSMAASAAAAAGTAEEPSEDEIIRRFLAWTEEHCDDDDAYVHNRAFMDVFLPVPLDQLVSLKLRSFYNAFNRYRRKQKEAKKHRREKRKGATTTTSNSTCTSATTSEDDDGMSDDNDSDVEMLNDSAFSMPSTPGSEGLRKRSDDYSIVKPVITQLAERKIPKYKVCIIVSGGAWIIGFYLWSALLARLFAAAGYVVFIPDYRNFPQTDVAGMAEDVTDAIVYVKKHAHKYHADASKDVTLIGHSAGSHLTMLSLIQQATLCAARDAWEKVHGATAKATGGSPISRADTATPNEDAQGMNIDRPVGGFALSDLQEAYRDAMQAENNNSSEETNLHSSIFNGSIFARSLLKRGSINATSFASFEAANKGDGATGIDLASLDYLPADSSFFTPALAEHHRHTHLNAKMTPAAPPHPRYHPPTTIHHYIGVSGLYDFTTLLDFLNKRGLYSSVMYRVLGYREKAPNEPVDPKEEEEIKDKLLKEFSPWWFLVKENKDGKPEDYRCSFLSEEHREMIEANVRDFNDNRSLATQWMKKHGKAPPSKPSAVTIDTQAVPYLPSTMRFVHGDVDMSAPPEQSNLMYAALSEAIHQYASEHLVGKKQNKEKKDYNKDNKDNKDKDKDDNEGDNLPNNDGINRLLPRVHLTTIPNFNHTDLINEQPLCGECTLLDMCNKDIHDLDTAVARFEAKKQHHPSATDKDSIEYPFSTKRPYNPRLLPEKMPLMIRFGRYVCPF